MSNNRHFAFIPHSNEVRNLDNEQHTVHLFDVLITIYWAFTYLTLLLFVGNYARVYGYQPETWTMQMVYDIFTVIDAFMLSLYDSVFFEYLEINHQDLVTWYYMNFEDVSIARRTFMCCYCLLWTCGSYLLKKPIDMLDRWIATAIANRMS